jgi:hypothetical protein
MSSTRSQLFRLARFFQTNVEPLRVRYQSNASDRENNYAKGHTLEVYWWLHFGVDLGFFPREESEKLVIQFSDVFFSDVEKFVERHGGFLSPLLRSLWVQAVRTKQVFPAVDEMSFPGRILPRFQAACSSSIRFANASGKYLLPAISFSNRQTWESLMNDTPSSDRVADLFQASSNHTGVDGLCADFFEVLQHMADMRTFFVDTGSEESIRQEVLQKNEQPNDSNVRRYLQDNRLFEQRVGMIQRWRLNLWQTTVNERFLEIASMANNLLRQEFFSREWPLTEPLKQGMFLIQVHDLVQNWQHRGGPQWETPRVGGTA